jgi:hypothetical protein
VERQPLQKKPRKINYLAISDRAAQGAGRKSSGFDSAGDMNAVA